MDDQALLNRYVSENSQEAFGEIVRRHEDLVYTAARRQVRDRDLAEDVAAVMGISLAAAAKRTTRAVERLRQYFAARDLTLSLEAAEAALLGQRLERAPASLARSVAEPSERARKLAGDRSHIGAIAV